MTVQQLLEGLFRTKSRLRRRSPRRRSAVQSEGLEARTLLTTLIGAEVTVTGTFQSNSATAGQELPLAGPERMVVEESPNDPEISQYSGLYDIDIDAGRISMVYNLSSDFGTDPAGLLPAGTFYRYYFDLEGLAPGDFVSSVTAEPTRNLVPFVSLVDSDTILVEIGPGDDLGNGFNALILVEVDQMPRSLLGGNFTVSNTFQSALGTSGIEIPVGDPATATITSGGPELESFADIYDIDVDSDRISMVFNLDPGAGSDPSGVIEAGTFDRYYFEFDLGTNEFISAASADPLNTLVPNVSISGSDTIVVEMAPGMQIGDLFDAVIDFEVDIVGSQVSGRKWQDVNNDGVRTTDEGWLNGWEIQLQDLIGNVVDTTFTRNIDLDHDGLIDPATEMGVYIFDGVQDGTYNVQEVLKAGWTQTYPSSPIDELAFQLDRDLGLEAAANDFLNWGGLNEKWVFGSGLWYFMTPDGAFSQWDGSPRTALTGTFIAQLDATIYNDPALLYNAPEPLRNVADVEVPNPVSMLSFGNYLAPPAFQISQDHPNNDVTFDWNEASPESVYEIWITDINTRRRFQVSTGLSGLTYTTNLPDRQYRVWMRTEYSPGVFSAWSASQEFEFFRDPIDPITDGLDAGIDATPTVQWMAQSDARSYDVRVTDAQGLVSYLATAIADTSHRIVTPLPLGDHWVAVRGNYTDGSRNDWSDGQLLVITGRPEVQTDGIQVWWGPVKAATQYEIWVDRNDNDGNRLQRQIVYANDITELHFTLPNLPNGRYAVWVRAVRAEAGEEYVSFWSSRVDFTIGANTADEPLDPISDALNVATISAEPAESVQPDTVASDEAEVQNQVAEKASPDAAGAIRLINAIMSEIAESDMLDRTKL